MKHIDEHILELYVLGSEEVRKQRAAIERHLGQCSGCSSIVEEMRRYYEDADREYDQHPRESSAPDLVLKRRETDLNPLFTAVSMPVAQRTRRGMERFGWYVRQHPVRSAIGGSMALVVLALLATMTVNDSLKDKALVSFKYNPGENTLEALNGGNDVLWKRSSTNVMRIIEGEETWHTRNTVVADLDGNGAHQVITTIPLWDTQAGDWVRALQVFDAGGILQFERRFNRATRYLHREYSAAFVGDGILVQRGSGRETMEVYVAAHNSRSPFYLARFDHRGELLGEYWHFGHLTSMSSLAAREGEEPLIVIAGINDTADSTNQSYPVVVTIDPKRVLGRSESSVTRGFGLQTADAEIFYVRLPRTDIADALGATEGVVSRLPEDSLRARFCVSAANEAGLEYVFSRNMEIVEIKPYTGFETLHARLVSEGKIHSSYGPAYFTDLKKGIRYWDGKQWKREVVRVRHYGAGLVFKE